MGGGKCAKALSKLIVFLFILCISTKTFAATDSDEGIKFNPTANGVTLAGNCLEKYKQKTGEDIPTNFEIPEHLHVGSTEYTVVGIADGAFNANICKTIETITIPNTVTTIGNNAFKGCTALTSIVIPNSVTSIGSSAFNGCTNLNSVTLPTNASFTTIRDELFSGCTSLASITIPANITSIGTSAFSSSGLTSITIPASVTSIGNNAFKSCSALASATFSGVSSCTSIGSSAFEATVITSVTIPASVTSIGNAAFKNCLALTTVTMNATNLSSIPDELFFHCGELTTITGGIPSSVTSIGTSAFAYCKKLNTALTIPDEATTIGNNAFIQCYQIPSITISDNSELTTIGTSAFQNCTTLVVMNIPPKVTSIGSNAFSECTGLTSITINATNLTAIPEKMLYHTNSLNSAIILPSSVTSIGNEAFHYSDITSINIPSGVTSIGNDAFTKTNNPSSALVIVVEGTTPASLGTTPFNNSYASTTIQVPCQHVDTYTSAAGWSDYAEKISAIALPATIERNWHLEDCNCDNFPSSITIKDGASLSANDYSALASRVSSINVEKNLPVGRWSLIGNLSTSSTTYAILNNNTGNINTSTAHEFVALPFDYSNNSWRYNEDHTYVYATDATPTNFGSFLAWPLTDEAGEGTATDLSDTYVTLSQTLTSLNENTTVSFSGITNNNATQWFALSNPYIGRLSLSAFKTSNSSDIQGSYCYVWDASASDYGNWVQVDMTTGTPAVAPTTGFFVAGTSASPTFSFSASQILQGTDHTALYKSEAMDNKVEFTADANGNRQKVFAQLSDMATNGFDREDSYVMFSTDEDDVNPYFIVEGKSLLDNRFNSLPYTTDINFHAYKSDVIDFTLTKVPQGIEVTFINLIDETETILTENEPISLSVVEGANANLYQLRFSKKNVGIDELANVENNISVWTSGKQINVKGYDLQRVEIYNTLGQKVYSSRLAGNSITFNPNLNDGAYIIKAYDKNNSKSEKVILK